PARARPEARPGPHRRRAAAQRRQPGHAASPSWVNAIAGFGRAKKHPSPGTGARSARSPTSMRIRRIPMPDISGRKIMILATHGFEQSELEEPLRRLREAGATVHVVAPQDGEIKGWDKTDWGRPVPVDRTMAQ